MILSPQRHGGAEELDPIKVAVAGTSFAGNVQIPVFQSHPRTRVVAVSSGRLERAEQVAQEHGIASVYTDFEEMLDKEKPHLVSIATPPDLHFPMTMAALQRGHHVLCEKPFALNAREAREMESAARSAGVVAMVDFEFRFLPARAYLADLLNQGFVGEIRMAEFTVHAGWRSKPEDAAWDWWSDTSRGGGLLGALGSHAVDSLSLWMGEVRRVFCDSLILIPEREGGSVTADDSYCLLMEFQSGARAVVHMTCVGGVDDAKIGVYGSEGQLVIPNYRATEIHGGKRSERRTAAMEIPEQYRLPEEAHFLRAPFRALLNRMIDAIDNGDSSPSPNFADGVASQVILDAARLSARQGLWVEV